jgi:DNA-binding MarR family transcriptional regulator
MLQLKDIPDSKILKKFADRYESLDPILVIQFLSILRIGTDLTELLNSFLEKHDLLQGRWWVLILLMREDDLTSTPSQLATKAGVSKATMNGLINRLLKDGLITRIQSEADGRSYLVKLSKLGQAKLDKVMPDYYLRVNKLMNSINDFDREKMIQQLMILKQNSNVFDG